MNDQTPPGRVAAPQGPSTFRQVFAVSEFRALWTAQVLSVAGDQLARVALTLLVFQRTGSALLAAITFAVSIVPAFIGGLTLSGLADRLPRRQVMIASDLSRAVLVAIMAIPGMPVFLMICIFGAVTMIGAPFTSARAALYPDILNGDLYVLGTAVTLTTLQFAQVIGFAAGGAIVELFGVRTSLLADAVTFLVSALITWVLVRARPAARTTQRSAPCRCRISARASGWCSATRRCARPCCSAGWSRSTTYLRAWWPRLSRSLGGGDLAAGLILAAAALGASLGRRGVQPPGQPGAAAAVDDPHSPRWHRAC